MSHHRAARAREVVLRGSTPALRLRGAAGMRVRPRARTSCVPSRRSEHAAARPRDVPLPNTWLPPGVHELALADAVASHCIAPQATLPGPVLPDLLSAGLLGAIAGGVDAAGWFCLAGLLPSHLTASLVMLGARVTEYNAADLRARVAMLPVFVCTVAGVKWSARWLTARKLPVLPVLLSAMTAGLALSCVAGALSDALLADDPRVLWLIGGLGVGSMAVQNAVMRLCLSQLCPTTVMTGNLTQLVLSGVDLLSHQPHEDARKRLVGAGSPLLGFLLGSITCGFIASRHGLLCLSLPLLLSAATTARAWRRHRSERASLCQVEAPTLLFPIAMLPRS